MYTWGSCSRESRNRPTCLQTAGVELLDSTAIKLKRPKVTGGELGVSSDTVRAMRIKLKLLINNLVYLETILLCKLYA